MNEAKLSIIAYICLKLTKPTSKDSIFSFNESKYRFYIDYACSKDDIHIYDYERNCIVKGKSSSLFDFSDNTYIDLQLNKGKIMCRDYKSGNIYYGNIYDGNVVRMIDYENRKSYDFKIV